MKKLIIAFCAHERVELTKLVIKHLNEVKIVLPIEIVVCSSPKSVKEDCINIQHKNYPLSQKHNALFAKCKELEPDGIVLIGSDDFISKEQINWYFKRFTKGTRNLIEISHVHFYNSRTKEVNYYDVPKARLGGGRFFSKWVLDKCEWKGWGESELNFGLDNFSQNHLTKLGIGVKKMENEGFHLGVHLFEQNISSDNRTDVGYKVEVDLKEIFGTEIGTEILELKPFEIPIIEDLDPSIEYVNLKTTSKNKYHRVGTILPNVDIITANVLVKKGFAYVTK